MSHIDERCQLIENDAELIQILEYTCNYCYNSTVYVPKASNTENIFWIKHKIEILKIITTKHQMESMTFRNFR